MTTELTVQQQRRLEACEEDIRTSIGNIKASMKLVGQALRIVRDEQLYLSTHTSFEEYVGQQWNLSRARAYQLIDFASAVANLSECEVLSTVVDTISERATRELAGLEPEQQRQVVMEASHGGIVTPTARAIREVIEVSEPVMVVVEEARGWQLPEPPKRMLVTTKHMFAVKQAWIDLFNCVRELGLSPEVMDAIQAVDRAYNTMERKAKHYGRDESESAVESQPVKALRVEAGEEPVDVVRPVKKTAMEKFLDSVPLSRAMMHAQAAVDSLRAITPNDPRRSEAMRMVIDWATRNEHESLTI